MMAEAVEHTLKPFWRRRVRMCCVLELVLIPEVDDEFVNECCQASRRRDGDRVMAGTTIHVQ